MLLDALILSLKSATLATIIATIVGTLIGRHLARRHYAGREMVDALTSLPMFLPPTVLGYYLVVVLGSRGPIGSLLDPIGVHLTFTWAGVVIAATVVSFPLMVRSARIAFGAVDRELEDSAALDGAGRWAAFTHIVLPQARSGLVGGVFLTFARAIGEFGATLMVAGNIPGRTQTMPLAIYEAFITGNDRTATVLAIVLTLVSLTVTIIGLRLGEERR